MRTTLYIKEISHILIPASERHTTRKIRPFIPGELYIGGKLISVTSCWSEEEPPTSDDDFDRRITYSRYWKADYDYELTDEIHLLELVFKEEPGRDVYGDPVEPGPGQSFTVVLRGEPKLEIDIGRISNMKIYDPRGEILSNGTYGKKNVQQMRHKVLWKWEDTCRPQDRFR